MFHKDILVSIVIPCKNEAKNISRCLKSIIDGMEKIDNTEIMLVDAASTDRTIELALQFPVSIIQLDSAQLHTSSAGRFLGTLYTSGKYIFIIDADMELMPGFLKKALERMEQDKHIAAVAGTGKDIHIEEGKAIGYIENLYKRDTTQITEVDYLAGAVLFKREAIEEAGYFNPYLYSQEELELCQRLKKKGWKLLSLPYPMVTHYSYSPKGIQTFRKQLAYNRFTGIGQLVRQSLRTGSFWSNLWRFKKFFFFLIAITSMVIATVVNLVKNNIAVLLLEGVAIALFYLYLIIRKRSFKKATLTSIKWLYIVFTVAKGFLKRLRNPKSYPQEVKIIRKL